MAFEQEGHTSILVGDKPTAFRFRVSVVNGEKLQIWLEDLVTKEQWSTKDLAMTDYVHTQYVKLHSHQAAYAKDFVDCLLANEDNKFFKHSLTSPFQENIRTLWLELLANFASRTSRFTYTFNLHLMVLDRIEVLASRVRDLEDENKSLKDVMECATQRNEALITLETVVETSPNTSLSWKSNGPYEPRDFQLDHAGQTIELVRGGRYLISLHFAEGTGTAYEMQINEEILRTLSSSCACAKMRHQTLSFMVCVAAKAKLRVVAKGANKSPAGSLLTVAPL